VCLCFRAIEYPVGWEMRKDVERYSVEFQPPGVEVHCLHGYGVNTVDR
jgi:lysophospholipase-3